MPMVAHVLHHLVHYCRRHGPLWTFWCYPFEKMLAFVKLSTHGTSAVEGQFAFYAQLLECLPLLEQKVRECNQVPSERIQKVRAGQHHKKLSHKYVLIGNWVYSTSKLIPSQRDAGGGREFR